jgi:hypothetical protein
MKPSWAKQDNRTPRDLSIGRGRTGSLARDSMVRKMARVTRERAMGSGWMVPESP